MSTWNFRIIHRKLVTKIAEYDVYELAEVYYNRDGSIWAYSDPVKLDRYEDPQDLLKDLDKFRLACEDRVIEEEELPEANAEPDWLDEED